MSNFTTFKSGNPDLALVMYSAKNWNNEIKNFDSEPIEIKTTPSPKHFALISEIWGRRVIDGKENETKIINANHTEYSGKIEVGVWDEDGDKGFSVIRTYYHPTLQSFDYDYQVLKGMALKQTSDELWIDLPAGTTAFKANSNKANFLLNYSSNNGSNKGRNPQHALLFENHNPSEQTKQLMDDEERKYEAMKLVFDLKGDDLKAKAFAKVYGISNALDTQTIVANLVKLAKDDVDLFMTKMEAHRNSVQNVLNTAVSNDIARFTKKGGIEILNDINEYQGYGEIVNFSSAKKAITSIAQEPFNAENLEIIQEVKKRVEIYNQK